MSVQPGEIAVKLSMIMDGFNKAILEAQTKLTGLGKDFDLVAARFQKTADGFKRAGSNLTTFLSLPLAAAGAAGIKFASDTEESLNKVRVSFKENSKEVEAWAQTSLKSYGISRGSALDMASTFGDMATSMGVSTEEAAKMATTLTGLGGDMSSFKNIGIDQSFNALKGIFTGEGEALKTLAVVMTDATLKSYMLEKGIQGDYASMSQAEKVTLRYRYVLDMTKNAQGDFARTQGGSANQMRIFVESLKEMASNFGSIVLPTFAALMQNINALLGWISNLDEGTKKFIVTVGLIAVALGPVLTIIGSLISAYRTFFVIKAAVTAGFAGQAVAAGASTAALIANRIAMIAATAAAKAQAIAMAALNAVMLLNPITLVILAVAALGGAIYGLTRLVKSNTEAEKENAQARQKNKEILDQQIEEIKKSYEAQKAHHEKSKQLQKDYLEKLAQQRKDAIEKWSVYNAEYGKNEVELENMRYEKELASLKDALNKKFIDQQMYNQAEINLKREHEAKITDIQRQENERRNQMMADVAGKTAGYIGQLGQLFSMYYSNQAAEIDNSVFYKKQKIQEEYDAEVARINAEVTNTAERDRQLEALDQDRARKEKKIDEKAEKEKRKMAREAAKYQRNIAVAEGLVSTAQAALSAYIWGMKVPFPVGGPILAGITAGLATAFGMAKVALIAAQPLPAAAYGLYAETPYVGGEAGPELAFPLNSTNGRAALASFSEQLIAAMQQRILRAGVSVGAASREATVINQEKAGNPLFRVIVNIGSKLLYDDITEATANGEIMVHARSLV